MEITVAKLKIIISAILKSSNILTPQMLLLLKSVYSEEELKLLKLVSSQTNSLDGHIPQNLEYNQSQQIQSPFPQNLNQGPKLKKFMSQSMINSPEFNRRRTDGFGGFSDF